MVAAVPEGVDEDVGLWWADDVLAGEDKISKTVQRERTVHSMRRADTRTPVEEGGPRSMRSAEVAVVASARRSLIVEAEELCSTPEHRRDEQKVGQSTLDDNLQKPDVRRRRTQPTSDDQTLLAKALVGAVDRRGQAEHLEVTVE